MSLILVLEDDHQRVEWLEESLGEDFHKLIVLKTVLSFLMKYDLLHKHVSGVVLDHDLGPESAGNGTQAVRGLIARAYNRPALVWSNNIQPAMHMAADLRRIGSDAVFVPFGSDFERTKEWILARCR
jgi:hypothetical protein